MIFRPWSAVKVEAVNLPYVPSRLSSSGDGAGDGAGVILSLTPVDFVIDTSSSFAGSLSSESARTRSGVVEEPLSPSAAALLWRGGIVAVDVPLYGRTPSPPTSFCGVFSVSVGGCFYVTEGLAPFRSSSAPARKGEIQTPRRGRLATCTECTEAEIPEFLSNRLDLVGRGLIG